MQNIEKRMNELIDIINKASYEYYALDNPTISDQEYDDYYNELLRIERDHPELKREDYPAGGYADLRACQRLFGLPGRCLCLQSPCQAAIGGGRSYSRRFGESQWHFLQRCTG